MSFVFYLRNDTSRVTIDQKMKKYFSGIKRNLQKVRELYNETWVTRLYFDVNNNGSLLNQLCDLACNHDDLDLCDVRALPGNPVRDAIKINAMNWRFFPTLDPQVDIVLSRDLDSEISAREVSAVGEWILSDKQIHAMRDHPFHATAMLGGKNHRPIFEKLSDVIYFGHNEQH